jgi:hypothetical protein
MLKSQAAPLSTRRQENSDFAAGQGLFALAAGVSGGRSVAAQPIRKPHGRGWFSPPRQGFPILCGAMAAIQSVNLVEVDGVNLCRQPCSAGLVQLVPKLQQVILPERGKSGQQLFPG